MELGQLYMDCPFCINGVTVAGTCLHCNGVGYLGWGTNMALPGVFPTYKIAEATDDTEYAALTSAQKTAYSMIVSLGTCDLSSGTAVKTKLWNMFGAGTTTRANLEALIA